MAGNTLRAPGLRARIAISGRRFHAWWEGYAFDADLERADIAERYGAPAGAGGVEAGVAEMIWGAGRREPGDPAWTMRHARTLGLPAKARVIVFGAGGGAPLRDLKAATRWKVSGLAREPAHAPGVALSTYEQALTRPAKVEADGGLILFDLHRDPDPVAFARFAGGLLKPGAPVSIVDFATARKGVRFKSCFADAFPRTAAETIRSLKESGFAVSDTIDETRIFAPLIAKGWARWRRVYETARAAPDARRRAAALRFLADYAHVWAERLDALKSGQLQVMRFQARKSG